jgi:hypothetical protein
MNHVELRISQNQIDVYATDAGVAASTKTLRHIAVIKNADLTLTRGLIWLEDVHYNADKGDPARPSQREHTVIVSGHVHSSPWPYPDQIIHSWRTFAVTIPITDLIAGTNVVQLGADKAEVFSNVDIVLVEVRGGAPVLPGSNNALPGAP